MVLKNKVIVSYNSTARTSAKVIELDKKRLGGAGVVV